MAKNTIIDGIAASEHLDSSGECLDIKGMDISSLGGPDSILNWEHGSKERPSQVVGKITFAKKILKESEASNKREKYFWNKAKKPFIYIKAELFDGLGHSGSQDVAAMLKYKNKDKGEDSRLVVGFSIEGGKIDKKGMVVTKSIARDVAITVKPCNKVCDAELIEGDVSDDFLYKNQNFDCEVLQKGEVDTSYQDFLKCQNKFRHLIISDMKKNQHQNYQEKVESFKDKKSFKTREDQPKDITLKPTLKSLSTENNMRKTLIAGMMGGSPDSKTGMAALASEEIVGQKKVKKNQKLEKMSRPVMGFKTLGIESEPHNVQSINPNAMVSGPDKENPGQLKQVSQADIFAKKVANKVGINAKALNPKEKSGKIQEQKDAMQEQTANKLKGKSPTRGSHYRDINVTMVNEKGAGASNFPSKTKRPEKALQDSRAIGENQEKMKGNMTYSKTKGRKELRGNFPATRHHETLHRTFSALESKYSRDHREAVAIHVLNNFIDKEDLKGLVERTKKVYKGKASPEEVLAQMTNFLQQKTAREEGSYKEHPVDLKRLGSGWKKAIEFAGGLTEEDLQSITQKHLQRQKDAKKPAQVKIERIPPGVGGKQQVEEKNKHPRHRLPTAPPGLGK